MTLENYEKAKEIVIEMKSVNSEIIELQAILDSKILSTWRMEIRPSTTFSLRNIDHCGMLPSFMRAILEKKLEKYDELKKELEKL